MYLGKDRSNGIDLDLPVTTVQVVSGKMKIVAN